MGGSPYWYIVPHEEPRKALDKLRKREFEAGRYNPVIDHPKFPITAKSPAPGAKHRTIEEALEASDADGTRSILDIARISKTPQFLCATPVDEKVLVQLLGTAKPTRARVEQKLRELLQGVKRGHAIYIEIFESGKPTELFFARYSVD